MVASVFCSSHAAAQTGAVKTGADLLFEKHFALIEGKRVGLITNHSALLSNGAVFRHPVQRDKHLADVLFEEKRTKLTVLFGPEHGIRGDAPDGRSIQHGTDTKTGLPVYSLYGQVRKPTPDMLKDVDVLIFDIQDIGARFYTYISTMSYGMEAAAELGIPYIVLDRPNPIRGTWVEGFIREDTLASFVGLHSIPVAHGMTIGELARLFNGEGWLAKRVKATLTVVEMEGWKRSMWYDETGLQWVRPSPNMVTLRTATVYPGTCFIEGTNLSEGRGTERPFEYIGAPWVDGKRWAHELNALHLPGVRFESIEFTPEEIPHAAANPKHRGIKCGGIFVNVTDRNRYEPVRTGVAILSTAKRLFPEMQWRVSSIDRLAGTTKLRLSIDAGMSPDAIAGSWKVEVEQFKRLREQYLLYQ